MKLRRVVSRRRVDASRVLALLELPLFSKQPRLRKAYEVLFDM